MKPIRSAVFASFLWCAVTSCSAPGEEDFSEVVSAATSPDVRRTVIFIYGQTQPGQDMFLRGGLDHAQARQRLGLDCTPTNLLCAIPITHRNPRNATTQPWKQGDTRLDWYGREPTQTGSAHGLQAEGTPVDWTTDVWPSSWGPIHTVATDGYGVELLNRFGPHFWMLDVDVDCSKGFPFDGERWFELKSYISGLGWEGDVHQLGAPYPSANHFAACGKLNVFRRNEGPATILPLDSEPAADAGVTPDAGVIRLAAVGDISNNSVGAQRQTAELTMAGGYDAVLLLGDLQYPRGSLADFNAYYEPTWGRLKPLSRPVPGNHEYDTANASGYFSYFGERAGAPSKGYYSFELGSWHVIALNTSSGCGVIDCGAGSPMEQWLRADLAAHPNRCTIAYWHHPRFSSGRHGNNVNTSALWNDLYAAGVELVLNGHDHSYERFAPQTPAAQLDPARGIREFVVGTGGIGFYDFPSRQPNSEVRSTGTYGILELQLKSDSYDWRFVPVPGSTFTDSGSGQCH